MRAEQRHDYMVCTCFLQSPCNVLTDGTTRPDQGEMMVLQSSAVLSSPSQQELQKQPGWSSLPSSEHYYNAAQHFTRESLKRETYTIRCVLWLER